MWIPAGVRAGIRLAPRRTRGARLRLRKVRIRTKTTKIAIPTGINPMSFPQSGVTNWAMISRIEVHRRSSIGLRDQCARGRATPVTPSTTRPRGRRP